MADVVVAESKIHGLGVFATHEFIEEHREKSQRFVTSFPLCKQPRQ